VRVEAIITAGSITARRTLEEQPLIPRTWRPRAVAAMAGLLSVLALPCPAALAAAGSPPAREARARAATPAPAGRPKVKLNRLTFPSMPEASYYKTHLKRSLEHAADAADWGADTHSVIEYRFRVDTLDIQTSAGLVRVQCAATGELPGGKNAKSRLSFSGQASQRRELVEKVLRIVAQGVITRLAQLEHRRRRAVSRQPVEITRLTTN
jgi:hypothetical protein